MQRHRRPLASGALLPLLFCVACGPQIQADRLIDRPPPPATLLQCQDEPAPPEVLGSDAVLFDWVEAIRVAGDDCRGKLRALRSSFAPAR